MKEIKKLKRQTSTKEDAGKLLLDLGKLVFGSIFLGGVLREDIPQNILVLAGFIVATIACTLGLFLLAKTKDHEEIKNHEKRE